MAPGPLLVLIVDDDLGACEVLCQLMTDEGYRVECYTTADGTLARLQAGDVGLVLLDWLLPYITGAVVLAVAASLEPAPAVVVITAWAPLLAAAPLPGAAAIVAKPFDLPALLALIRRLCPLSPAVGATARGRGHPHGGRSGIAAGAAARRRAGGHRD
ncbi:MAG TPA: response regulator [Chloroflexota bacterium]|jgi:DNA-binding NtrC family response regulator